MTLESKRLALRQGSLCSAVGEQRSPARRLLRRSLVVLWRSFTSGRLGFTVGLNVANYLRVFADKDIMADAQQFGDLRRAVRRCSEPGWAGCWRGSWRGRILRQRFG